jgi:DNA-binding NtrC family response regulator
MTLADGLAANLHLLRPIRVLVASRDLRFVSLVRFLLGRAEIGVDTTPTLNELPDAVQETSADIVVIDADGARERAARAVVDLEAVHPDVAVMVVADGASPAASALAARPKWLELEKLSLEIQRAYLGLDPAERRQVLYGSDSSTTSRPA